MKLRLSLILLVLAAAAWAQGLRDLSQSQERVTAGPAGPVRVRAGSAAKVELPFRVAPGFHINSNQPKSDLLIPTLVHLDPPTDILVGKVEYPAGKDVSFSFAPTEKLNVYQGDFAVTALVSAARRTSPGRYRVRGALKYQACDDRACYPPTSVPVAFDVQVLKALSTRTRHNPAQSPHIHR